MKTPTIEPAHEIMVLITKATSEGSPEPEPSSLFAHIKYGSSRRVQPKIRHLAHWMVAHARLKNEFTEDEKYHNLMSWLNYTSRDLYC